MKHHMTVSGPIRITWSQQELCGNRQSRGRGGSTSNPVTFLHWLHGITPALGGARALVSGSVRYALACRDGTNHDEIVQRLFIIHGLSWLRHDKLKHIGHSTTNVTITSPRTSTTHSRKRDNI